MLKTVFPSIIFGIYDLVAFPCQRLNLFGIFFNGIAVYAGRPFVSIDSPEPAKMGRITCV